MGKLDRLVLPPMAVDTTKKERREKEREKEKEREEGGGKEIL